MYPKNTESVNQYSFKQYLKVGTICLISLLSITFFSYELRNFTNSLLLYLPIGLSIVLVHWYGYRILPVIYLNAIASLWIWRSKSDLMFILIVATHEPLIAFVSKFLVDKVQRKQVRDCLGTANQFVLFMLLGILIPISFNCFYTYHYSFINGDIEKVTLLWLSDFITTFCLALPLLYFFYLKKNGAIGVYSLIFHERRGNYPLMELMGVTLVFVALSFFVPFGQYWFIYGIITVVIGVRQGFESVILINTILFLINYILPLVEHSTAITTSAGSTQLINVHLGNATMLFVSTLVGRVVSDLRNTENTLLSQKEEMEKTNQQLNQTNLELDRFVYSVSHDLSAPLKSIQGLIHISRMETLGDQSKTYLDMMEKSATRLNDFINEVLDYSRTSRKELDCQNVNLKDLMNELKEKLILHEDEGKIQFHCLLQQQVVFTDSTLLKIALGNLISNAMKFQKKIQGHTPEVSISSFYSGNEVYIEVKDNGEGIPDEHVEKIFDMFYRATSRSPGSGLGLYIAREAVDKLGGSISVQTKYDEGSAFTIHLPNKE
jgi:signal transduction histidine kinase